MLGFFREHLTADEQQEMLSLIGALCEGLVPLIVPVTLMQHDVRKYGVRYPRDQTYLNPHPLELKLRHHA